MQTVKISAGMTDEYEIIKTDAPTELIKKQLRLNSIKQENSETIDNSYNLLEDNGYSVELIGCQYDFDENKCIFDIELDTYDYI